MSCYIFKNTYISEISKNPEWGTFITPDADLETLNDPNDKYNIPVPCGVKANFDQFTGMNPAFDTIAKKIAPQKQAFKFEDQCSGKYYFDVYNTTQMELKKINRILEVGVFMGGSSSIFAGCIENTEVEFDMLDVNSIYLRYAYERIRRLFPEVAKRTRMFLGDLPTYVKSVLSQEKKRQYLIHHDGSHNFNEVISDLASLSFVRDKVRGLMIQDTHLRGGNINSYIFVDAAVYAIFGADVDHSKLGVTLSSKQTVPAFQFDPHGTYLKANLPEGMYIPFANNTFQYPHPQTSLDDIIMKH